MKKCPQIICTKCGNFPKVKNVSYEYTHDKTKVTYCCDCGSSGVKYVFHTKGFVQVHGNIGLVQD